MSRKPRVGNAKPWLGGFVQIEFEASPTATAFMQSNARHRFMVGPFGSGKTVAVSIMENIRRAAMQRQSTIDGKRKSRIAIIRNTIRMLSDTVIPSFLSWFPSGTLGQWGATSKTYKIRVDDIESDIIFRALDDEADMRNLLSLELTLATLSEFREIPRAIVEGLDGRVGRYPPVREGGCTYAGITGDSNMPEELSYWYAMMEGRDPDDLKKKKESGFQFFRQPAAMLLRPDGSYVLNPLAENVRNLPEGYYHNLVTGKSPDYIRTFVLMQYGQSKGGKPVHSMFNHDVHVAKAPLLVSPQNLVVIGMDFGLTPAAVFKQQDAFGRVLTLDEVVTFGMGIERAMETKILPLIRRKYDQCELWITGDPSGESGAQTDERSCVDILKAYKRRGITKIKMAYSNSPVHRQGATDHFLSLLVERGQPAYQIDPGCEWLIQALGGRYQFKKFKDGRESSEVADNDWTHVADANQYADMHFERGGRRKAEHRDQRHLPVREPQNPYAMPR